MDNKKDLSSPKIEVEKNWSQVLAIFIGGLAGLNNGLLFSWPSPFLVKIAEDKVNYDITEDEGSYFNIIHPISLMIACPFFAMLIDRIGRKKTLMLIVIPQVISWLLSGFAKSLYVFYAARVTAGIADGCLFATLPAYIGEIANPTVRGKWGNVIPTFMYIGEFFINIIGSYVGITTTTYICLPLPALFLILFSFMPESPYFYIITQNEEKAKKSLRFLKRINNIDDIYNALKKDVERQIAESGTWLDLVRIGSNRRALIAGFFLRITQQLSGFSVFLTFTQLIFQKSGGNISHELSSIIYLGICIVLNLFAITIIVPRFGRLTCFITSSGLCAIVMYIMAIYIYIDDNLDIDVSKFKWIPLCGMIFYQLFACYGLAVIPTLMLSELYSASVKSKAMILLVIAFGLGLFISSSIFYQFNTRFGFYSPFFMFAACCTISTVLSYYIIPETRGKTLEEIQHILKKTDHKEKLKSSLKIQNKIESS